VFKVAAAFAVAAAVVLALGVWFHRTPIDRGPAPLVAELAEAVGAHRLVEPRLTGGFRHGRLTTLRSGDTPQGLDAQSPAVLAAVARIRQRAEGDTSPEALGALGITYLVSGDVGAAVKALESASAQRPDDARLLSDLAAAYLVRAAQADQPADIPKALEAAERAIALTNAPAEAYFNRALALERLHLVDAARNAWGDYLQRDAASGWADEARQHLEALPKPRQSSAEEDRARVRTALEQGPAATERLADESSSLLRDYLEDELLPAWAEAHLAGHPDAQTHRERVRLLGDALLRTTGDAMARDTARTLVEPSSATDSRDPLRSQALGYRDFREAKRAYDLIEPSCPQYRRSLQRLETGGSPYAGWARLQVVIACFYPAEQDAARAELARLEPFAKRSRYLELLGRVRWLQGLIHEVRGELTEAADRYRSARVSFQATKNSESEAVVLALLAENIRVLGEGRAAWREREQGLERLGDVRNPRRRHGMLSEAVLACLNERMPRSALQFDNALVETAYRWSRAAAIGEALARRAAIHHALGADDRASSDLREARQWADRVVERSLAERLQAEIDAVEGGVLTGPAAALSLGRSLAYFREAAAVRVPALQLLLARAQMARGLDDAAEEGLLAGMEEIERSRISLHDVALQVSFLDQAVPLFDDMVRFQVARRRDPARALAFVERGRARQLLDSLDGVGFTPLEPEALQRELPRGVTIVYYVTEYDRLFAWTLSRDELHFIERPLPAAELSRMVAAHRAALERRAPADVVRRTGGRLHDELVRPLTTFLASKQVLVFVPDADLQSVAFATLWDRNTGRYLVEDHVLGSAPNGTVFVRASAAAAAPAPGRVKALVVGNPHFDRHLWSGLSDLPGAEAEAGEIARLYAHADLLTGSGATKRAFLERARGSQTIHYAGHAVSSVEVPSTARLLLAADPRTGDSGALYLHELRQRGFPRTRVVVLAACRTAAGAVSRVEGALSLGRPFLAAGVPDVVASLWDIDDSVSRRFFLAFHRALLVEGDPFLALRTAQIALLRDSDATLAHPASWAAFICMGGINPHSLSKGEAS
jgi:CHAT domain-containing protein